MSDKKTTIPRFEANLIIRGIIEVRTGLHIGGSKEKMEIGGIDSIVVRSPRTSHPYLPGSSIKGKMRHLLEYFHGVLGNSVDNKLGNVSLDEKIVRVFGIGANEKEKDEQLQTIGLTRLIVRDAHPTKTTIEMWENKMGSDSFFTEYKAENTIDRITSAANPRFIERVVEGSEFEFEMVYTAYFTEEDPAFKKTNEDVENIFTGLRLLESSAIGGSGSRGYGKVKFKIQQPLWLKKEDYQEASKKWETASEVLPENAELLNLTQLDSATLKYTA